MQKRKGLFITFEGIEGSGKSTHCHLAAKYLKKRGYSVLAVREPGGTKIGEKIRHVLLDRRNTCMTVECELLLYNAARVQIVNEVILPALRKGTIVLCDRFVDSTIAYQCYGGHFDPRLAGMMNTIATFGLEPHRTFLFDSDVKRGLKRAGRGDRMECKSLAFHKRVRLGFLRLAEEHKKRFCVIKEMSIEKGHRLVAQELDTLCR